MPNLSHPFRWLQCADGSFPTGLDILHLTFPNRGHKLPKISEVCWEAKPFEPPTMLQAFIEQYDNSNPLYSLSELYDCIVCLLLSSVLCIVACLLLHYILNKVYTKFALISPSHKKWYVVINVMKGAVLGFMVLNSKYLPGGAKVLFGGDIPILETKRTTVLYVMTDLVGIVLVPKLPFSTLMHHFMTIFIGMGIWFVNIGAETWEGMVGVAKMAFLYGSFITISFAVNIFLGLRVMFEKKPWMVFNCYFALITYIVAITLIWSLHLSWIYHCLTSLDMSLWYFFYGGLLLHIIRDDIILIRFLWRYPSTTKASKKTE